MNLNQLAKQLNKTTIQIKEACKELFGQIPTDFNQEVQEKIANYFDKSALPPTSKIATTSTSKPLVNQPKATNTEEIDIDNLSESDLQRLIRARKKDGDTLADLVAGVKVEAFCDTLKHHEANLVDAIINQSLTNTIHLKHLSNQIAQLNGTSEPKRINISRTIKEEKDKQLEPQELITKYLLPVEEESEWEI